MLRNNDMKLDNIKLNELTIYSDSDNMEYVRMLVPEGFSSTINVFDSYSGDGFPYCFSITHRPDDNSCAVYYHSPKHFVDDHLSNHSDYDVDDFGFLHHEFINLQQYLDKDVSSRYGGFDNLTFVKFSPYIDNEEISEKRKTDILKSYENTNLFLNNYYYCGGISVYSYDYDGQHRYLFSSAILEAVDFSRWEVVKDAYVYESDPFLKNMMASVYPNLRYDNQNNRYVYTLCYETDWTVRGFIEVDCAEEDYNCAYNQILVPTIGRGVKICDDIWNDFKRISEDISQRNYEIRQDKQTAAQILAQANMDRLNSNKELYESLRKTQQETHDILNSSYEHSKQVHDRIDEQRTDVFRGNTRFVDSYGNEHIIHTSNRYAYKKGRNYVTSDSPLQTPYEWEELKKKKY